ncbi:MAG: response regulator [Deltaproteobacteria bacterium]|nr:MAG: response regulator [Deltaproteobacteria bacterium]
MTQQAGQRPTVAIAHEEEPIRRVAGIVLEDAGFAVVRCSSGAELLEAVEAPDVHAAVADVGLEDLPGYELAPTIRRIRPDLVIVLVSAVFRRTSYKRRPRELYGADAYVELHHVADHLPERLWAKIAGNHGHRPSRRTQEFVRGEVEAAGDGRLLRARSERIVQLVVSDALLYGGADVAQATDASMAARAVQADIDAMVSVLREFGVLDGDDGAVRKLVVSAVERAWARMRGASP